LPGFLSLFLLSSAARAATVEDWHFDNVQQQLDFTTDEAVQPMIQLIANPTRLVIDLPGTHLGSARRNQSLDGAMQSIRIGQFDGQTTRIVIVLAPGYQLDPEQIKVRGTSATHWTVQLPNPTMTTEMKLSSPIMLPQPVGAIALPTNHFGAVPQSSMQLDWLQQQVTALWSKYPSLRSYDAGVCVLDLDNGSSLNLHGDKVFPAASIIKLPILIAFLQDVDTGKISLNETLVMTRDVIVGGSGELQDLPPGSKFSALETINKMITISDNTATNMIIKRMGGFTVLNQRFRQWGLQKTVLRHWLPDLRGTNTTTAKELTELLGWLDAKRLLSPSSQALAVDILQHVKNRKLLVAGLGPNATISHKTGDIGFLLGDAGLVTMPSGKRYLIAMLVTSAQDDPAARDYIQAVSRLVYRYLSQRPTSE